MVIDENGLVSCECGAPLGQLVENHIVSLSAGGLELLVADGRCGACHRAFHYRSGRALSRIIARKTGKSLIEVEKSLAQTA